MTPWSRAAQSRQAASATAVLETQPYEDATMTPPESMSNTIVESVVETLQDSQPEETMLYTDDKDDAAIDGRMPSAFDQDDIEGHVGNPPAGDAVAEAGGFGDVGELEVDAITQRTRDPNPGDGGSMEASQSHLSELSFRAEKRRRITGKQATPPCYTTPSKQRRI